MGKIVLYQFSAFAFHPTFLSNHKTNLLASLLSEANNTDLATNETMKFSDFRYHAGVLFFIAAIAILYNVMVMMTFGGGEDDS